MASNPGEAANGHSPGGSWTRAWFNVLDEGSTPMCPSTQASTPLQDSKLKDEPSGPGSPSQSSVSLSDADLGYDDDWKEAKDVKWKTEENDDVTRSLPAELLLQIMQMLPSRDLPRAMLVSKSWCLAAFPLVWQKPPLTSIRQFESFVRVLSTPDPVLPYATTVRRLVFNGFARHLTDELFTEISACKNLERLTLPGATRLTSKSLNYVFGKLRNLVAIDVAGVTAVDDYVAYQISVGCPQVQGLNLAKCSKITDEGVKAIASRSKMLRRIKLCECKVLTDQSIIALTRSCPLLLELDLAYIPQLSNDTTLSIFFNVASLRELRMNDNEVITAASVPDLAYMSQLSDDALVESLGAYPWYLTDAPNPKAMIRTASRLPPTIEMPMLRPISRSFDQLRIVDFTSCEQLGDPAIDNLVSNAPQLRNVTLAKCTRLTDAAVESLARLGKHLHYVHLGHVARITDNSIVHLAQSCTRLRYVDLANCDQLTDRSVIALATNLPKLRRIGFVKVINITDRGVATLAERGMTLERLHLSYCDNITLRAISFLLGRLPLLVHLSLTGVTAFKTKELRQFCRPPPDTFNPNQRASFCVYSAQGVSALRNYLDSVAFDCDSSPWLEGVDSPMSAASTVSLQPAGAGAGANDMTADAENQDSTGPSSAPQQQNPLLPTNAPNDPASPRGRKARPNWRQRPP